MHREKYTQLSFELVDKGQVLFKYLITKLKENIHHMKSLLTYSLCADTDATKDRMQTSNAPQKKNSGYSESNVTFF